MLLSDHYVTMLLFRLTQPVFFINSYFSHIHTFFPTLSLKNRAGNFLLVPQRSYGPGYLWLKPVTGELHHEEKRMFTLENDSLEHKGYI